MRTPRLTEAGKDRVLAALAEQNRMLRQWIENKVVGNQSDALWQEQWFALRDSAKDVLWQADLVVLPLIKR